MPAIDETPAEKTMRRWYEMKLADNAAQTLHQAKGRKILNRLAVKSQDGTIGKPDPVADQFVESDDMQIRIGDEVNHFQIPPEAISTTPTRTTNQSGWLKKAALAAALLGAGGGTGAALPWIVEQFQSAPSVVEQPADKDTLFELHLGQADD